MKDITEVFAPVKRPEKALQYGEGNFLRAFVDWQIDIANEKTDFNGNVVVIQPIERGMAEGIQEQKGLYTTVLRGVRDGKTLEEYRAITAIGRCLNAYTQFDEYMACAENPGLRFVFSNTTEAGIAYNAGDRLEDRPPRSFPGKAASFLYKRFRFFNGDTSKALVFIPCELIDKNGDKLKELVERYGREWNLGDAFFAWLGACDFCNSLVDRIVPGYPREEAEALQKKLGYADPLLDAAEVFHLWVIETKQDHSAELPLVQAGLNVIWTEDMSFYRTRKVRILNGAHTLMVPAAFLCGLNTVGECVDDPLIARFMKKGIFDEIIPSMDGDAGELVRYAGDVLDRFANPSIRHPLLSITLNSVSKFRTRLLPSLLGYLKKKGALPVLISFSLAALIAFYRGSGPVNGELQGDRNGEAYPVRDDEDILKRFAEWYAAAGDLAAGDAARGLVHEVLSAAGFWGEDLSAVPGLEEAVSAHFAAIQNHGVRSALEGIVSHA